MSEKIKSLIVKVTYRVGLGDLEMPKKVKDQLIDAFDNNQEIDPQNTNEYKEAAEWLSSNIQEKDCTDWECEVWDISQ